MTTLTFPRPADAWCEGSLSTVEAHWASAVGNIAVDTTIFAVGQASVKCWTEGFNYYIGARLVIDSYGGVLDTKAYANTTLHFTILLQHELMSGVGYVVLEDISGRTASALLSSPSGQTTAQDYPMSEFTAQAGFDWTKVHSVTIFADQVGAGYPPQGGAMWIDQLYFSMDVPDSVLLITSSPTGQFGTFSDPFFPSEPFVTPSTFTRPVNDTATIQMNPNNFDHWADDANNKNPSRMYKFPVSSGTIQAVYSQQVNPALVIDSFDQAMNNYPAVSGAKIVYNALQSVVALPFFTRTPNKGLYTLTAIETAKRKFDYWIMPDKSKQTTITVSHDFQMDARFELHWTATGNGGGEIPWLLIGGAVVGVVLVGVAWKLG